MSGRRNIYVGFLTAFINITLLLIFVAILRNLKTDDKNLDTASLNPTVEAEKLAVIAQPVEKKTNPVVSTQTAETEKRAVTVEPDDKSPSTWASGTTAEIEKRAATDEPVDKGPRTWTSGTIAETATRAVTVAANSVPGRVNLWNYNRSTVRLEAVGRSRRFYYVEPDRDLPAKSGDMVFEGVREGVTYSGLTFLSSEKCATIAYHVKGTVSPDETTVKLRGNKPRRDDECHVVNYVDEELVFSLSDKL